MACSALQIFKNHIRYIKNETRSGNTGNRGHKFMKHFNILV